MAASSTTCSMFSETQKRTSPSAVSSALSKRRCSMREGYYTWFFTMTWQSSKNLLYTHFADTGNNLPIKHIFHWKVWKGISQSTKNDVICSVGLNKLYKIWFQSQMEMRCDGSFYLPRKDKPEKKKKSSLGVILSRIFSHILWRPAIGRSQVPFASALLCCSPTALTPALFGYSTSASLRELQLP